MRMNWRMRSIELTVTDMIGVGGFGRVFRVVVSGKPMALKVVEKAKVLDSGKQIRHLNNEKLLWSAMAPNIFLTKYEYSFQTKKAVFFLMEFVRGGELFEMLEQCRRLEMGVVRFVMAEVLLAVEHLHNHEILYRDLKPENIMIGCDGHVKIVDFGLCKGNMKSSYTTNTFCGTIVYMAPEVIMRKSYGRPVDLWALGAVGYDIATGNVPFDGSTDSDVENAILEECPREFPSHVEDADFMDLIGKLLKKDPKERMTVEQMKNHQFFATINWDQARSGGLSPPSVLETYGKTKDLSINTSDELVVHMTKSSGYDINFKKFDYFQDDSEDEDDAWWE